MNWKNLPTWIKGGIIGIIFFIIALLFQFLLFNNSHEESSSLLGGLIFVILAFPSLILLPFGIDPWKNLLLSGITVLTAYFLIGALIGWIIGLIKKKN